MTVRVKVMKLHPDALPPSYAHSGPYGDLAADLLSVEFVVLAPRATRAVRTGLAIEFPSEFGALIQDRSGLALRGISTLAGVIDPGYRGELKVVLTNLGKKPFDIKPGDRIAQLRIVRRIAGKFTEVPTLSATRRDTHGFGSTGD
jgi:dUTP pyrophosphatase